MVLIVGDAGIFIQHMLKWDERDIRKIGNIFWGEILAKSG